MLQTLFNHKKKLIGFIVFLSFILIIFYFSLSYLNNNQKQIIKRYLLPYMFINQQEKKISEQKKDLRALEAYLTQLELNEIRNITITESKISLSNNKTLKKYKLNSGFSFGIHEKNPGSGYIDFHDNKIFVISSRGVLAFSKNLIDDKEIFKTIENNISDFIGLKQFMKNQWFSIKDMLIWQNQIFVSYTDEIKEDCWNTSVIIGDIDYENINFKKLYSADECVHSVDNVDKIFNAHQSGGRIIPFKNDTILLTVGDYRSRHLAQNKESVNGKIIKIDINKNNYEIVSMGHRNPQGLYFDKDNNIIIETEHGPNGGDEINLINVSDIENKEIPNYGWAISSAGEHYGGRSLENKKIYEKYPLHKSHSEHGFIEPLKSFVPSIAISEIVKVGTDNYVVGSMGKNRDGDKSLYFFDLENKRISNLEQVKVFERIRDLKFYDNKLYLFMEDTASIGIINID